MRPDANSFPSHAFLKSRMIALNNTGPAMQCGDRRLNRCLAGTIAIRVSNLDRPHVTRHDIFAGFLRSIEFW
jgi:hypothetical protein